MESRRQGAQREIQVLPSPDFAPKNVKMAREHLALCQTAGRIIARPSRPRKRIHENKILAPKLFCRRSFHPAGAWPACPRSGDAGYAETSARPRAPGRKSVWSTDRCTACKFAHTGNHAGTESAESSPQRASRAGHRSDSWCDWSRPGWRHDTPGIDVPAHGRHGAGDVHLSVAGKRFRAAAEFARSLTCGPCEWRARVDRGIVDGTSQYRHHASRGGYFQRSARR